MRQTSSFACRRWRRRGLECGRPSRSLPNCATPRLAVQLHVRQEPIALPPNDSKRERRPCFAARTTDSGCRQPDPVRSRPPRLVEDVLMSVACESSRQVPLLVQSRTKRSVYLRTLVFGEAHTEERYDSVTSPARSFGVRWTRSSVEIAETPHGSSVLRTVTRTRERSLCPAAIRPTRPQERRQRNRDGGALRAETVDDHLFGEHSLCDELRSAWACDTRAHPIEDHLPKVSDPIAAGLGQGKPIRRHHGWVVKSAAEGSHVQHYGGCGAPCYPLSRSRGTCRKRVDEWRSALAPMCVNSAGRARFATRDDGNPFDAAFGGLVPRSTRTRVARQECFRVAFRSTDIERQMGHASDRLVQGR